ncbi:MAG: hypothetical protein ABSG97_08225 [Sedimentisphaerales bacterium]
MPNGYKEIAYAVGISTNAQLIVIGMIIVVAVAADQLAQSRTKKAGI